MKQSLFSGQERERLIEDITERVLSRISVTVDASDIIEEIADLRRELERLYGMFE